jgi:hypothetical protein
MIPVAQQPTRFLAGTQLRQHLRLAMSSRWCEHTHNYMNCVRQLQSRRLLWAGVTGLRGVPLVSIPVDTVGHPTTPSLPA